MDAPPLLLLGSVLIVGYCLPSIVAFVRQHSATPWICVLNLCFGWTVVGWLVALFWSTTARDRQRFRYMTTARSQGRRVSKDARSIAYPVNSGQPAAGSTPHKPASSPESVHAQV